MLCQALYTFQPVDMPLYACGMESFLHSKVNEQAKSLKGRYVCLSSTVCISHLLCRPDVALPGLDAQHLVLRVEQGGGRLGVRGQCQLDAGLQDGVVVAPGAVLLGGGLLGQALAHDLGKGKGRINSREQ